MNSHETDKAQKKPDSQPPAANPSRLEEFSNELFESAIETAKELSILNRQEAVKIEAEKHKKED
ncbi:MAG TPA: hypothetical protein PLZ08_04915 [Bacillota bacterium]|nr:hypothetical protein [Bacillota bacterium]HOL09693.1 hypothetical protein [Bacillota bacterium]HPO97282.1 hypothetical protein [Bacillota bacterium]